MLVSKVTLGGRAIATGYQTDWPVITIVHAETGDITYRVESGFVRFDVRQREMRRAFAPGSRFHMSSIDLKDDWLELKLEGGSGNSAKLRLLLGQGWQSHSSINAVMTQLARVFDLPKAPVSSPNTASAIGGTTQPPTRHATEAYSQQSQNAQASQLDKPKEVNALRQRLVPAGADNSLWQHTERDPEGALSTSYLRFYSDGTVIGITVQESTTNMKDWGRPWEDSGEYVVRDSNLKFSLTDKYGTVEYDGKLQGQSLQLHVYSHINNNEHEDQYELVPNTNESTALNRLNSQALTAPSQQNQVAAQATPEPQKAEPEKSIQQSNASKPLAVLGIRRWDALKSAINVLKANGFQSVDCSDPQQQADCFVRGTDEAVTVRSDNLVGNSVITVIYQFSGSMYDSVWNQLKQEFGVPMAAFPHRVWFADCWQDEVLGEGEVVTISKENGSTDVPSERHGVVTLRERVQLDTVF